MKRRNADGSEEEQSSEGEEISSIIEGIKWFPGLAFDTYVYEMARNSVCEICNKGIRKIADSVLYRSTTGVACVRCNIVFHWKCLNLPYTEVVMACCADCVREVEEIDA